MQGVASTRFLFCLVPAARADTLLEPLREHFAEHPHVAVLSDEIYSRIVYDGAPFASMLGYREIEDRLILLDGWSKTYAMTGWRLGWAVWPRELVEHATRLAINIHSCVNAATQYAGIEALTGPQDAVEAMVRAFDERRDIIVRALNDLPGFRCIRPGGAFYAFPSVEGTGHTARDLQDALLNEAGVATVAGTSFGEYGEGYVRFSYASSIDNIQEAVSRIRRFLERRND